MILRQARGKSTSFRPCLTRKSSRNSSSSSGSNDDSKISEFNQEMEAIFGAALPSGNLRPPPTGEPRIPSQAAAPPRPPIQSGRGLTHVGAGGEAQMVDVSGKEETKRTAMASCKVLLGREVFGLVAANQMVKGDVLGVAKIAGIGGAKQTASLIPLCHNIGLSHVDVDLRLDEEDFSVRVAMEALTAAAVAGLTVYDMCKATSKDIQITDLRLDRKTGGKSGDWSREP
ncbi:unnamed protein product [Spirodela intermedia]|uniref:cyclic pyranopterin monophosphate synthase n=1 Tax=Spirodela intermedia TaxID=51605 RepID=A0A7I8J245_SPIIN|nr:unnamed protein product [Spirodela intermedia]CAA6664207.1 unnamed protein product [Spirodela intermedia]